MTAIPVNQSGPITLNIDGFLQVVGEYGKFQKILTVILGLMLFPFKFVIFILFFTSMEPEWRCVANSSRCLLNGTFTSQDGLRCRMPKSEWEYVQPKEYSIIVAFDLACGNEWLVHVATSIMFVGALFGAIFLGWYSDHYGRKKLLYFCFVFVIMSNFLTIFVPNICLFIGLRFVTGFMFSAVNTCYYVMLSETVGDRYRPISGSILWSLYAVALCILPLKAYLFNSWKHLVVACSLPYLLLMTTYQFVPESFRWLRLKGRFKEAMEVFQRIAEWNGKKLDPSLRILPVVILSKEKSNLTDLFRSKRTTLTFITFVICCYTNGLVYFGASLASGDLGTGSLYLNFLLVSLVEFPALLLASYCCNRFGRKRSTMVPITLAGLTTFLIAFTPPTTPTFTACRVVLGMLGKLAISMSFPCAFNLLVEAYPTNIRSEVLGIMDISVNVGGASAPWVARGLARYSKQLPFLVMGAMGLISGLLCWVLPETKGVPMKESQFDFQENGTNKCTAIKNPNFGG